MGDKTLETPSGKTFNQLKADGKDVVTVGDAGHVMMIEKPKETVRICREFLLNQL